MSDNVFIDLDVQCYVIDDGAKLESFDDVGGEIERASDQLVLYGLLSPQAPVPAPGTMEAWAHLQYLRAELAWLLPEQA